MKNFILWCCVLSAGLPNVFAQNEYSFRKETFRFAQKDTQELFLDRYTPETIRTGQKMPCLIFVFGGAFARGARDVEKYMPYFEFLTDNGYTVVSIDYRLGLKDIAQRPDATQDEFVKTFIHTIDMAVEDLFDATLYVLDHADDWNIDKSRIVANGSSAGAVTVLQGAYAIANQSWSAPRLPSDFRYAGVIAFAGAIFVPEGELRWDRQPSPIMMFHGDADLQVPYDSLVYEGAGLYGASFIARTLKQNNWPYHFYTFTDYGHEIASDPMKDNKQDVLGFLDAFVRDHKPYQIESRQKEIGKAEVPNKNFNFYDYVKGNFDR